jgi:hypothetical protein
MARIEGTGQKAQRRRLRLPKVRIEPVAVIAVCSPAVLLVPDVWMSAILLPIALWAAWRVGHRDGVNDMAREVERGLRRDDRAA